jgi:hypothetical protein
MLQYYRGKNLWKRYKDITIYVDIEKYSSIGNAIQISRDSQNPS